jgi:hypothetical protein
LDTRTAAQVAAGGKGRGLSGAPRAAANAAAPTAVVGALALAAGSAAPAIAIERREAVREPSKARPKERSTKASAKARPKAPSVAGQPRSWLNLGGPQLSSLGKGALAISAIETCWGALVLALALVEIATQNSASKPYLILAGIWFALVFVLCLLGGQLLSRPVYRRGRISRPKRSLNGFGLVVYSLAVHAIAVWGVTVFSDGRPNAPLAIIAFVLFAVNVFAAGVLALANTLG